MDDFLTGPRGLQDDTASSVPASPGSSIAGSSRGTIDPAALSQISMDIAAISSSMLTRRDKSEMVAELRAVIREEIAAVRADLTALEHRVDALDADRIQNAHRQQAVDLATTRQGNLLLDLRRQVEDLDNRGRRNNIQVRGLPEAEGERPQEILTGLFTHLLALAFPMLPSRTGSWRVRRRERWAHRRWRITCTRIRSPNDAEGGQMALKNSSG
ncbi:Hypothetical predicted protein [Pelobates cultripes]|uniref:Uncharacterized protein n=1 Tax=Pelobates cultripes TaxID=61616 RepID=A0AAD1T0W5_PELCU|nr:Hypothetical predicted protein [Pelobates cultripes]